MPNTSDTKATSIMAKNIDPCDHCAIIKEKLLPTPLVTMALFILPIVTNNTPVIIDARTPDWNACAILRGPMTMGVNIPSDEIAANTRVAQDTNTKHKIAQQAA